MNPKISIIMSVHNGIEHLCESIESILHQTFADFEFVIIDDASLDETPKILAEYVAQDSRIRIITNKENLGLTKSLNIGVRAAHGEYIARMDAGDTSESRRFEKQVAFLDAHQDYGLIGTFANVIDTASQKIGEMKYVTEHDAIKKALIRYNPIVHSSIMMRRDILDRAGLYNEDWKYAQDYELYFRMIAIAKIAVIPEYLVSYRISPKSITRNKNKQQTMFAIRARLSAIHQGQYPWWSHIYLIRPFIGYTIPIFAKEFLKNIIKI